MVAAAFAAGLDRGAVRWKDLTSRGNPPARLHRYRLRSIRRSGSWFAFPASAARSTCAKPFSRWSISARIAALPSSC